MGKTVQGTLRLYNRNRYLQWRKDGKIRWRTHKLKSDVVGLLLGAETSTMKIHKTFHDSTDKVHESWE